MMTETQPKIAVLDDYQNAALQMADWSSVQARAEVTFFHTHLSETTAVVERLRPFAAIVVMRERTPLSSEILHALPQLKLIVSTGPRNASIDLDAAKKLGIEVLNTGYESSPTIEMTWALILGVAKHVAQENASIRAGGWQIGVGADLRGKTLGILGLGRIGSQVAKIGQAFGMNLISWSQNLTLEKARSAGASLVTKEELFRESDFLTIHLVLSQRSRGLVSADLLSLMKPTSYLINTSRGPIVDEQALVQRLEAKKLAGAAVDVYDIEPLPENHPFRSLPNVLATPHIGYVSKDLYRTFYGDAVSHLRDWLKI